MMAPDPVGGVFRADLGRQIPHAALPPPSEIAALELIDPRCYLLKAVLADPNTADVIDLGGLLARVTERLGAIEANQARLETALKAHGVGAWQERA
jgi:hypothetical protein